MKNHRIPTPVALRLALVAIWGAAGLWAITGVDRVAATRQRAQTIGRDAVPSIVAAEEIRGLLAKANARAVTAWVATGAERERLWQEHDEDMGETADRLVTAASNITYAEERAPIVALARGVPVYRAWIAIARERGYGSTAALASATTFLREKLLPRAEQLDAANFAHLDSEWQGGAPVSAAGHMAGALVALLALTLTQVGVAFRFKRLVNPALALATVAVVAATCQVGFAVGDSQADLREAKSDAFDSIHVLWKARAIAADALADESWRVLRADPADETRFLAKTAELARGPITSSDLDAIRRGRKPTGSGLLADELRNVTFEGEGEAAVRAFSWLRRWEEADAELDTLASRGKHAEAVAKRLSRDEGGVARAYHELNAALKDAQRVNAQAFEHAVSRSFADLDGLRGRIPAFAALVALLAWAGLRGRIREYAV